MGLVTCRLSNTWTPNRFALRSDSVLDSGTECVGMVAADPQLGVRRAFDASPGRWLQSRRPTRTLPAASMSLRMPRLAAAPSPAMRLRSTKSCCALADW